MAGKWRRRNFFIKKELQGRYMLSFFLFVIGAGFFLTAALTFLSADYLTISYRNSALEVGKTPVVLAREILSANWILILGGGAFIVVLSMFLTHRFAGPIFRFERSLEEMSRKNLDFEIKLRSRDEAKELADKINSFNSALSADLRELKEISENMNGIFERAGSCGEEELRTLTGLNKRARKILDGYRIKNDV